MPMRTLCLLLCIAPAIATTRLSPSRKRNDGWLNRSAGNGQPGPEKAPGRGVIPGAFYTPDLQWGIRVARTRLYRPDKPDNKSQNAILTTSGHASSTGAFALALENHPFLSSDRWRIFTGAYNSNTPAGHGSKGDAARRYQQNRQRDTTCTLILSLEFMYQIAPDFYTAGWSASLSHTRKIKSANRQSPQPALIFSSAATISPRYDNRHSLSYLTRDTGSDLQYYDYAPAFGSDTHFSDSTAHFSLYHSSTPPQALALETHSRATQNRLWNRLPSLDSSQHMRGGYQDNNLPGTQIEFHQKLSWRHGVVGTLPDHLSQPEPGHWLPGTSPDSRFKTKPEMTIRLDYGTGKASNGFYFQQGKAFCPTKQREAPRHQPLTESLLCFTKH